MLFARARSSSRTTVSTLAVMILTVAMIFGSQTASSMEMHTQYSKSPSSESRYTFKSVEACFIRKINRTRDRHGLNWLAWDKQLGYVARRHARQMAAQRSVYHDPNMGNEVTRWRTLGQNTGRGSSCRSLHRAFMRSSSHRRNVFGNWRFVGVGVEHGGGRVYVQQIFEARRDPGNVYHWP